MRVASDAKDGFPDILGLEDVLKRDTVYACSREGVVVEYEHIEEVDEVLRLDQQLEDREFTRQCIPFCIEEEIEGVWNALMDS